MGGGEGQPDLASNLKAIVDAYGVAVRAGMITPVIEDESFIREKVGLPPVNEAVRGAWTEDGGIRRPITLQVDEGAPVVPTAENEDEDESR